MSHTDEYYLDDFTVSTTKKEKNNQQKILKIQNDELKNLAINKINNLPKFYRHSNDILINLVKENKLMDVYDGKEIADSFYDICAKINITHDDFKHLTCDEIFIRIPSKYRQIYEFSSSARCITSKDLKKYTGACKTVFKYSYYNGRGYVYENSTVATIPLDVFNHENKVILLRKFSNGINLKEMLQLHPKNRIKIITEVLQFLHEICDDSQLWRMKQNLSENIIFNKNQWTAINNYYYSVGSCSYWSRNNNLRELAKMMGTQEEFQQIFKNKFWNCKKECIFSKEFKEIFCDGR